MQNYLYFYSVISIIICTLLCFLNTVIAYRQLFVPFYRQLNRALFIGKYYCAFLQIPFLFPRRATFVIKLSPCPGGAAAAAATIGH
jgi:hypothetical protein